MMQSIIDSPNGDGGIANSIRAATFPVKIVASGTSAASLHHIRKMESSHMDIWWVGPNGDDGAESFL